MTVHDIKDSQGRVFAFEVGNLFLPRAKVREIVESIQGVRVVSQKHGNAFLEFEVEGRRFEACEPFGDSSRFWIGPEPAEWCQQVDRVRAAFLAPKDRAPNQALQPTAPSGRG